MCQSAAIIGFTIARSDWEGLLEGRRRSSADVALVMPLQDSDSGGSGAFLALASDERRYWIKPLNNCQGERVPITEQIVGRVGALIGAPTCEVRTVAIPPELTGWCFRGNHPLEPGIAHGSLHVDDCVETRTLEFRSQDDNRRRHCFILALHDWCWGGDGQWLRVERDDQRYYSHDHGWYLPPEGAVWSSTELERLVDEPRELPDSGQDFGIWAAAEVANQLEAVNRNRLIEVLEAIPDEWPVSDEELEAVGFFLERRARTVADRIRTRLGVPT